MLKITLWIMRPANIARWFLWGGRGACGEGGLGVEGVGEVGLSAAVGEGTRVGPAGRQSGGRGGGGYRRMSFGRVASGCDLAPYLGMAA